MLSRTRQSNGATLLLVVVVVLLVGAAAVGGVVIVRRENQWNARLNDRNEKLAVSTAALELARERGKKLVEACREARQVGDDLFAHVSALITAANNAVAALERRDSSAFARAADAEESASRAMYAARSRWSSAAARCTAAQPA